LQPEQLPPEARHYEKLLSGTAVDETDDTVDDRRQFDAQRFHAGSEFGVGVPFGDLGLYVEVNVWDRLALGIGGGISYWGLAGGTYARLRPIVWGGEGRHVLNAITVEAGYAYMSYGGDPLGGLHLFPCIEECHPSAYHVSVGSHIGALSIGLEHALWNGFTLRYAVGGARLLATPKWRCELEGRPAACADAEPEHRFAVVSFAVSHAL
jgi:hypothetical protein